MRTLDNSAQIFNSLSDVPGDVQDVEELIEVLSSFLTSEYSVIFLKNFMIHILIKHIRTSQNGSVDSPVGVIGLVPSGWLAHRHGDRISEKETLSLLNGRPRCIS